MNQIKKNSVLEIKITAISSDGMGVGRSDSGIVVFVPFTAIGDHVQVKAVKVTKSVIHGKLLQIITASPARIEPDCQAFSKCGGCDFRHISYEAELKAKEGFIHDAFIRVGKLELQFLPIIGSEKIERYRNKAQYPIGKNNDGKIIAGFYSARSHRIVACGDCKLQPAVFNEIVDFIVNYIKINNIPIYDEDEHSGVIRHICIRKGNYSGQINICIVATCKIDKFNDLSNKITEQFSEVEGVVLNINPAQTNVIYGNQELLLVGEGGISDTMCGIEVVISPRSFYQVNTPAAEKLYETVAEFAQPEDCIILDLYCGIGTIGLSLAGKAKEIIGIEREEASVKNAVANAKLNNINNTKFMLSDAEDLPSSVNPDVVILDPARKGCELSVLQKVASLCPSRIVMVSCNPATAARDCARLAELGYKSVRVRGVDLFPRTRHVECVIELTANP